MKLVIMLVVLSLSSCCSTPHTVQTVPQMVEVEYSGGYRTEVWRRPDGTFFLRFPRPSNGEMIEMDIHH